MISVVIPAYNEERYLPRTLHHLNQAKEYVLQRGGPPVEIMVVDNGSADRTAPVAAGLGAGVLSELIRNIAVARNAGARATRGDVLVFTDADTVVPETLLSRISGALADPACLGGAVDPHHAPRRLALRAYLQVWRYFGLLGHMAQGATQFCRRDVFEALGGYDETLYMGEDVDFYWRLRRLARGRGARLEYVRDVRVAPSCRRFDQWPLWRTLLWTNPAVILLCRRHKGPWGGWYRTAPR